MRFLYRFMSARAKRFTRHSIPSRYLHRGTHCALDGNCVHAVLELEYLGLGLDA
jgi:hypothetical protein